MTTIVPQVLVSAGEPSADRLASLTLRSLASMGVGGTRFGLIGAACRAQGAEMLQDQATTSLMGVVPVALKLRNFERALRTLVSAAIKRRANAALLVGCTSFHKLLGRRLRALGIPVLWCVAPQVWAWRKDRIGSFRSAMDTLAVLLPFEQQLWRQAGYKAFYVGHPAEEITRELYDLKDLFPSQQQGHALNQSPKRLVLLPGSRAQEVRAMLNVFIEAAQLWCERQDCWTAETIVSQALDPATEKWIRKRVQEAKIPWKMADIANGAAAILHRYDLAICASGTASLEAALAGINPVIAYRTDPLTAAIASRLLITPFIALPNILLNAPVFPEVVQRKLTAQNLTQALFDISNVSHHADFRFARSRLRRILALHDGKTVGLRTAELLCKLFDKSSVSQRVG